MKTIAIVNHKGGVGKTTTALNFGSELAKRGRGVLLIDLDMQGNLSSVCGIKVSDDDSVKDSISDVIDECYSGKEISNVIQEIGFKAAVDIIPCGIKMSNTLLKLNAVMGRELWLSKVLKEIDNSELYRNYDYCIIDCAPSVMVDFQNALVAADEILMVANPDKFSVSGLNSLLMAYQQVKEVFNPRLSIAGILINNADKRTNYTKNMVESIKDSWKNINVFETVIPQSIRVKESIQLRLPVWEHDPKNPVAIAFSDFTDEYLKGEVKNDFC